MKKSLLASVSLGALVFASGSQAADMAARPVYKAPVAAPMWSWTGFYVGANVGIARARSSVEDDPSAANCYLCGPGPSADKTGIIGGLQAGYNWQFNSLVLGLEGDISFASLNRSVAFFGDTFTSRLDALGTLRGRVGWAFDRWLVFGTGGAALADVKDSYTSVFPFTAARSSTAWGWTAGGGIEYAVANNWTVKAEFLHVVFQDQTVSNVTGFGYALKFKDQIDIGRVGINYKF